MIKAMGLISGGLDSTLAARILLEQGIRIYGIYFINPFDRKSDSAVKFTKQLGIPIKQIKLGSHYLKIIRNPKHGVGAGLNPCIDCRIFMLKKAKQYARKIKADFIFTGDVLGQRPMSQTKQALDLIDRKTGLKGKLLRPLSAKLLPETDAEKNNLINSSNLLALSGRSRKTQIELAKKYHLIYTPPAGGCLLCEKLFSGKLADLFKYKKKIDLNDIELLKLGRHFRQGKNKIIVGRDEKENNLLLKLKTKKDIVMEAEQIPGPVTLLQGSNIKLAAQITMRYADENKGIIKYDNKEITVKAIGDKQLQKYRIT